MTQNRKAEGIAKDSPFNKVRFPLLACARPPTAQLWRARQREGAEAGSGAAVKAMAWETFLALPRKVVEETSVAQCHSAFSLPPLLPRCEQRWRASPTGSTFSVCDTGGTLLSPRSDQRMPSSVLACWDWREVRLVGLSRLWLLLAALGFALETSGVGVIIT